MWFFGFSDLFPASTFIKAMGIRLGIYFGLVIFMPVPFSSQSNVITCSKVSGNLYGFSISWAIPLIIIYFLRSFIKPLLPFNICLFLLIFLVFKSLCENDGFWKDISFYLLYIYIYIYIFL